MEEQRAIEIIANLRDWFSERQYKGTDPYQLDEKAFSSIKNFPFVSYIRTVLKPLHSQVPGYLFSKFPQIYHPKAIGLIISANSKLFKATKDNRLIIENMYLLKLLSSLRNPNYKNACWGHPFEWGRSPRYPKNIPLVCVQAPIVHSLIDFYKVHNDDIILKLIESSINYLLFEACKDQNGNSCSFRNSPIDKMHVHNSNIMVASLFYRYNDLQSDKRIIDLADDLIRFTLKHQNKDGSWYYSSNTKNIDNRHTGFVLRALSQICEIKLDETLEKSLDKGLQFYINELFEGVLPKWSPGHVYPIDIHDIAQSIIVFSEVGNTQFASQIADFALESMSNGKDEFYYKLFKDGRRNEAVFIRWGQAWMMLALATYLERMR